MQKFSQSELENLNKIYSCDIFQVVRLQGEGQNEQHERLREQEEESQDW
jgi:hypothetical protein